MYIYLVRTWSFLRPRGPLTTLLGSGSCQQQRLNLTCQAACRAAECPTISAQSTPPFLGQTVKTILSMFSCCASVSVTTTHTTPVSSCNT
jgi:hypothetical protein